MNKWIVILASLVMWGCSSSPKIERLPDTANATDEVSRFEKDMTDSASKQSDILSPKAWKEASDYLQESKSRLSDGRDKSRVLYSVSAGRAWMDKANAHADQASGVIPDLLQVRKEAMESGAGQYASNEFTAAENDFREYTHDRENDTFGIPTDKRTVLRNEYITAQTVAMQNHYLGDARKNLHQAKEKGARTLVPNLWENALHSEKNAEAFIAANREDVAGIEANSKRATTDAENLNRLTDEAIAARDASPEQRALALDRVKQRNQNLSAALDQQAFDAKYDEARQMFLVDEAEVYKQGNKLLLRMKGIEFPVGRATLPTSSYPLITKVSGVIKSFGGSPKVRIEGHTDATGSAAINQQLSQKRGESVKEYLVSNGLRPETVEVVGVRDTRPLASNKTKAGRAENRRVDIFIMPVMQDNNQIRQAQ